MHVDKVLSHFEEEIKSGIFMVLASHWLQFPVDVSQRLSTLMIDIKILQFHQNCKGVLEKYDTPQ